MFNWISVTIMDSAVSYKKVETIPEFIGAIRLRVSVFIIEQGFKPGWEPDEDDKKATHYVAINPKAGIVAAARVREISKGEYKIERMVVAKEYRGKGVGKGLLEYLLLETKRLKPKKIWLRSQVHTKSFYEKCGFKESAPSFAMWGVMHIDMEYTDKH